LRKYACLAICLSRHERRTRDDADETGDRIDLDGGAVGDALHRMGGADVARVRARVRATFDGLRGDVGWKDYHYLLSSPALP